MDLREKIILAPMAGVTDPVFRGICKARGADVVVTEMVSSDGLEHGAGETEKLAQVSELERPVGVQIFGADPERMGRAASRVAELARPDFIDLNSGCPVRKVVRRNGGAGLLRDPVLFGRIVEAMVRASTIPVTVKIRSGWSTGAWVDTEYARIAEQAGAAAITLHPRSAAMMYSGHSYWERIALVKQCVGIPVIGNGDIVSPADAVEMKRQTGCDSIMIGRACLGNPWIFGQCRDALEGRSPRQVTAAERIATVREHLASFVAIHGPVRASAEMKRHIAWYTRGLPGAAATRDRIFHSASLGEMEQVLEDFVRQTPPDDTSGRRPHAQA